MSRRARAAMPEAIGAVAQDIDRALGKHVARKNPMLVGLVLIAREMAALHKGSYLRPLAPFVMERRKLSEAAHEQLIDAWHLAFGAKAVSCLEAVQFATAGTPSKSGLALFAVLKKISPGRNGKLSARVLGKWLQRRRMLRIGGRRIEAVDERNHCLLWQVETSEKEGATV